MRKAIEQADAAAAGGAGAAGAKRKVESGAPAGDDDETVEAKRRRKDKPGKADGVSGRARKTELPAGAQKPIKWKPLIAKELATCGGRMRRRAAQGGGRRGARASHSGRQTKELKEEFDRVLPTFKRFVVEGNQVRVAS